MPELPEVETVMRGIAPLILNARIESTETFTAKLRRTLDPGFRQRLTGAMVEKIDRRAKFIKITTNRKDCLILHLGMSGKITLHDGKSPPDLVKHDHVRWLFTKEDGHQKHYHWITFNDARRFGMCDLVAEKDLDQYPSFQRLGPEPLDSSFTGAVLVKALKNRKSPVKLALMDQKIVAGLGNIYVCEALWRAGIDPAQRASDLDEAKSVDLAAHIKDVLREAIHSGGSTLRDYVRSDGSLGYFQHRFNVYDRQGKACNREACCGVIKRVTQANRLTYYCSSCQTPHNKDNLGKGK